MSNETIKPLARSANLVTKEVANEVLVYDLKTHQAHCLNQVAALVWRSCDGNTSITEIALLVQNELHITIDEASVWFAVERLSKVNLLAENGRTFEENPKLSRREAMRKLGLGAALTVPVVLSIVAPTAQAGNTCDGSCQTLSGSNSCKPGCETITGRCYNDGDCNGTQNPLAPVNCNTCNGLSGSRSWQI